MNLLHPDTNFRRLQLFGQRTLVSSVSKPVEGNMRDIEIPTRDGAAISLLASALASLAGRVAGTLLLQSDATYDVVRKVWNGMVDRRPALIARCARSEDVVTCTTCRSRCAVAGTTTAERPCPTAE
jgi:hypothetical protein